jgi:hypothetical protein
MTKRDEQKFREILEDRMRKIAEKSELHEKLMEPGTTYRKKQEWCIKDRLEKELTVFETRLMVFLKPFEEKMEEIVEDQERVRVCHRDEIQKLQETVRKQEEKIKILLECLMI